jgi:UDP-3-O-[3-hydroxymyristoyl] glucosamine N-acyltransferase
MYIVCLPTSVESNVTLVNCVIGQHVMIHPGVRIGQVIKAKLQFCILHQ